MNVNTSSHPAAGDQASDKLTPIGFKVDISRGERVGRVSSEWFSRPDDERYLSLSELHAAVRARADRATSRTIESRSVRVEASRDNAERLALIVPGRETPVAPTHCSFGQLCGLVGAPSAYLRGLPAPLAGINLQHGLLSHRTELMKTRRDIVVRRSAETSRKSSAICKKRTFMLNCCDLGESSPAAPIYAAFD